VHATAGRQALGNIFGGFFIGPYFTKPVTVGWIYPDLLDFFAFQYHFGIQRNNMKDLDSVRGFQTDSS
jgi:hypothetical protein